MSYRHSLSHFPSEAKCVCLTFINSSRLIARTRLVDFPPNLMRRIKMDLSVAPSDSERGLNHLKAASGPTTYSGYKFELREVGELAMTDPSQFLDGGLAERGCCDHQTCSTAQREESQGDTLPSFYSHHCISSSLHKFSCDEIQGHQCNATS